jgi:L-Ala-D/L-Glu epimerase
MLDESIATSADLVAAQRAGACDLINLKLSKAGGLIPCLRLAAAARMSGIGAQAGAMVGELGVLAAARRRFAAMVRDLVAVDAPALVRRSIVREDALVDYVTMTCGDLPGPGLGVTLHESNVERLAHARVTWTRDHDWVRT